MRPIKFRAYIKDSGIEKADKQHVYIWNSVRLLEVQIVDIGLQRVGFSRPTGLFWFSFDDVELMENTGLHDKNGVEIWEGDIVQQPMNQITGYDSSDGSPIWGEKVFIKGHVIFKDGRFEVEETLHIWLPSAQTNKIEVLGNIYEHPELLKGEKS